MAVPPDPEGPAEPGDVTPSDRQAAALEGEASFRALAESAPAILWITDATGSCTFVSRRWEEITGQPQGAALAAGWSEPLHPEDRQKTVDLLLGATLRREPFGVDYRLRQVSGEYRWVIGAGRPHFGLGGDFLGLVGAVIDIDDRKRAEIALRRAQQVARFLANSSVALTDMSDARSILQRWRAWPSLSSPTGAPSTPCARTAAWTGWWWRTVKRARRASLARSRAAGCPSRPIRPAPARSRVRASWR